MTLDHRKRLLETVGAPPSCGKCVPVSDQTPSQCSRYTSHAHALSAVPLLLETTCGSGSLATAQPLCKTSNSSPRLQPPALPPPIPRPFRKARRGPRSARRNVRLEARGPMLVVCHRRRLRSATRRPEQITAAGKSRQLSGSLGPTELIQDTPEEPRIQPRTEPANVSLCGPQEHWDAGHTVFTVAEWPASTLHT